MIACYYTPAAMLAYNGSSSSIGYRKLSLPTQTTYARLLDLLIDAEAGAPAAGTSLVSKVIRGRRYWYAQRQDGGKRTQSYLGPETPEIAALVERARRARDEATSRAELVAMARAGGAYVIGAAEADVLARLSGAFRMGAVLIGSHAFVVLGNMLGVRWQDAIVRTEDIDIAHDHRIALALARNVEPVDVSKALGDPVPRFSVLSPDEPATSFQIRGSDIQVELLTPLVGRESSKPIKIPALAAAATPLRFLDYLIEETQPAVALGGTGVLVNVPRPGRFALHKLIVAARRTPRSGGATKAAKDLAQASALLRLLATELPGEITIAWKALHARGKAWVRAVQTSLVRLDGELVKTLVGSGIGFKTRR
jgi:hypothetical protein